MKFYTNYSLKNHNTFGIDVKAEYFTEVREVSEFQMLLREVDKALFILGSGSNILFTQDLPGLVVKNSIAGIRVIRETGASVWVRVGAGVGWHDFVLWCLRENYGGVENLSLIPGTVGAAPIQNIGAYGVELKEVFDQLEAVKLSTGMLKTFVGSDCEFGYRDSIFKRALKGKYFIASVTFRLSKAPKLNTSYGVLKQTLTQMKVEHPTIRDISRAVIAIRQSKLPDPAKLGNSGSFFKNPVLKPTDFNRLKEEFPNILSYPLSNGCTKIPAGWLIEQCGWKGKRFGDAGCYENQALVLVNYGKAGGREIEDLAKQIVASVEEKFGIRLEPEVLIVTCDL